MSPAWRSSGETLYVISRHYLMQIMWISLHILFEGMPPLLTKMRKSSKEKAGLSNGVFSTNISSTGDTFRVF